jgi:hypothetical protein
MWAVMSGDDGCGGSKAEERPADPPRMKAWGDRTGLFVILKMVVVVVVLEGSVEDTVGVVV